MHDEVQDKITNTLKFIQIKIDLSSYTNGKKDMIFYTKGLCKNNPSIPNNSEKKNKIKFGIKGQNITPYCGKT